MPLQPNKSELLELADYAHQLSFFDSGTIPPDGTRKMNGWNTSYFSELNSSACVQDRGDYKVIMFAGSKDIADYTLDMMAFPVSDFMLVGMPGRVHAGFLLAWTMLRSKCLALLGDSEKSKPLVLLGHSLGASLATISAGELHVLGYPVVCAYLYGSPRTGDSEYAKWSAASYRSVRVVNSWDPVTTLPFRHMLGYEHVGDAVYLKDGTVQDSIGYRLNPIPYLYRGVGDHGLLKGYVAGLSSAVSAATA